MISAAHIVVYTKNAEADREFFRDVLGFSPETTEISQSVDFSIHVSGASTA